MAVYGRADLGLAYSHVDPGVGGSTSSFTMDSSNGMSSHFGLRGEEDLGSGWRAKFVLENGFDPDTGSLHTAGRIFDREATLQLAGPMGTVAFGRESILGTDGGSFNMLGFVNPFGTGIGAAGNQNIILGKMAATRFDNAVTWQSPKFGGFQASAAYAMGENKHENKSGTDRYWGAGATYMTGPTSVVLLAEGVNEAVSDEKKDPSDMYRVTLGGNWNFGFMTVYAFAHVFRNADAFGSQGWSTVEDRGIGRVAAAGVEALDEIEGESGLLGLDAPLWGGKILAAVGALKGQTKEAEETIKASAWFAALAWQYRFSPQVRFYSALGYSAAEYKTASEKIKPDALSAVAGLSYYF